MHQIIERMVIRFRHEYPDAVAVLLKGSHARNDAARWSDIDFDVLISTPEFEKYRSWIELVDDRLVHVSAAVKSLDAWERDIDEPSSWSYGLPTCETTQLLWAVDDDLYKRLNKQCKSHPEAAPEVEDVIEALGKVRSALARGDILGVFQAAQVMAKLVPTLLILINPPVTVSHAREALAAVLAFKNVPDAFTTDWLTCLGMVDHRTAQTTTDSAERLVRGTIALIPADASTVGADIARLLIDGTISAYLTQDD